MKNSAQIAQDIAAAQRELLAIERGLPVIYDRGTSDEQEDAEVRLVAYQNRVKRLQERLEVAKREEQAAVERDRLAALRLELETSKTEHDRLTAELEAVVLPLAEKIVGVLPEIDRIAAQRSAADAAHQEAHSRLHPDGVAPSLSFNMGMSLAVEDAPEYFEVTQLALYILLNTRRSLPGGFEDAMAGLNIRAQQEAAHRRLAFGPRDPEPVQPGATDAEQNEIVRAELFAKLQNRGAVIG